VPQAHLDSCRCPWARRTTGPLTGDVLPTAWQAVAYADPPEGGSRGVSALTDRDDGRRESPFTRATADCGRYVPYDSLRPARPG